MSKPITSSTDLFNVRDIFAVVTGGGSGLVLIMARAMALNGAKRVYIIRWRQQVLDHAVKDVGLHNVVPLRCDVTKVKDLKAAAALVEKDIGDIDLQVANSGTAGPSGDVPKGSDIVELQETLFSIPKDEFTNTYHVNCTPVFYTTLAFLGLLDEGNKRALYQGGRSQVIATSSIGSFNRRITAGFAYGTSKAATTMMIKVLATYIVPYRIRANVLCAGLFPTDLTTSLISNKDPTQEGAYPPDQILAERAGMLEDIMGPLLYLASRAGAYCNGNGVITNEGRLSVTTKKPKIMSIISNECLERKLLVKMRWYPQNPITLA